jgi:DnaJ-class molecular chaperone
VTDYELLGVSVSSTPEELSLRRRALAQTLHPDRQGGDAAMMARVNAAHARLTDPLSVKRYKADIRSEYKKPCLRCKETGETYKQKGALRIRAICPLCNGVGRIV